MGNVLVTDTKLFSGQGYVMYAFRDANGNPLGFEQAGNVDALSFTNASNKIEKREQMTGQRGVLATLITENTVNVSMDWSDWSPKHLALGLRANVVTFDGAAADVVVRRMIKPGDLIGLEHMNATIVSVNEIPGGGGAVFLDEAGAGSAPAANYELDGPHALLKIAADQTAAATPVPPAGIEVDITYKPGTQTAVEPFTRTSDYVWLRFAGLNTAEDDRPVLIDLYKFEADLLADLALINPAEFVNWTLPGTALLDSARTTGSPYYSYKYLDV